MMQNRIRQLREEKHMTQLRLSTELGMTQETISAYETGKHLPSLNTLIALADLFGVSVDYLLGRSPVRVNLCKSDLSGREASLLAAFARLPEDKKQRLEAYLEGLQDG